MAREGIIQTLEKSDPAIERRIVQIVNQYGEQGQKIAAEMIGVSQPTISGFLKERGYVRVVRYEKQRSRGLR